MKRMIFILSGFLLISQAKSYQNLSPAQVHDRLIKGDTLLILDVREYSEYISGHIAEPAGQLPITPVLMPWSSGVLSEKYNQLPQDVDIIVHCKSMLRKVL